jgi:ribonuclease-3
VSSSEPLELTALQARLGHRFVSPALLEQALTHGSRAYEDGDDSRGNERLEFLGDAVLNLLISEQLMTLWPAAPEGVLSRARAAAVNTAALAELARELGLGARVRLGRGEDSSGGRAKPTILADVFEAVLGALYLDGGLAAARDFVAREFAERLRGSEVLRGDAKTRLQEWVQERGEQPPSYQLIAEWGPDHARRFEVEVCASGRPLGRGEGPSKRAAEQEAARRALEEIGASWCVMGGSCGARRPRAGERTGA